VDESDLLEGGAGGRIENDYKGVALLHSGVLRHVVLAPGCVPDLHLYVLSMVLKESYPVLSFEGLSIVTGEVIIYDAIEELSLPSAGQTLQQDLKGELALTPARGTLLGSGSGVNVESS